MSNVKGYEMTIEVTAKTAVYGEDATVWTELPDIQRGLRLGEIKSEVLRYFTDELEATDHIDINVTVSEVFEQ